MPRSARYRRAFRTLFCAFALGAASPAAAQERRLPEPLVYLRDIDASIIQDIRYAGPDNFTGRRVPGYLAAECVLLREVAEALSRVQQALKPRKLSLKVYDCYRPVRAVRAFVAWVKREDPDPSLKRYHPQLDRSRLISLGYIAAVSRHSHGDAVDLTLVPLPAPTGRTLQPRQGLWGLHRSGGGPFPRQQRRHGNRLRLLRPAQPHPRARHHRGAAALASHSGGGHAAGGFPQLPQGVVAFHLHARAARSRIQRTDRAAPALSAKAALQKPRRYWRGQRSTAETAHCCWRRVFLIWFRSGQASRAR